MPQPRSRAESQQLTRRRLLEAGVHLAQTRGLGAVTASAVAHHAGLSSGALYANFTGHADLMLSVVSEMAAHVSASPPAAAGERAWLRGFAALVAEAADEEQQVALLSELVAASVRVPAIKEVVGEGFQSSVGSLCAAAGSLRGRGRSGRSELDLAVGVSALVLGLSQLRVLLGEETVSTEMCARLFEAFATPTQARRTAARVEA